MPRTLTTEQFIEKANKIHNHKYDYSLTKFINSKIKIRIICPIHGEFEQLHNKHLSKKGCPKCGFISRCKLATSNTETFIKKAIGIFPEYDYSKVKYKQNKIKVCIVCPIHGPFYVRPNQLLRLSGCSHCGREKAAKAISLSQEEFLKRATKKHHNRYDYSLVIYKNKNSKIKIICPLHNIFEQQAGNHLNGEGCKKCAVENEGLRKRSIIEPFIISQFKKAHGDKYDYSKVIYLGSMKKVEIICKKHGSFWQRPAQHKSGVGCPGCRQSKGETSILNWIKKHRITCEFQKKFQGCKDKLFLPFDFYLPDYNACIEYDGELHYKKYENSFKGTYKLSITKKHDKIKNNYCKIKGIRLLRIPYWRKNKIPQILNLKIASWKIELERS
jgi:hypothetical protein